jgi:hypothetical protein
VATGDGGCEAYTAIAWGVGLSHERSDIAGAEGFQSLEGNMCGTAMRGADALPDRVGTWDISWLTAGVTLVVGAAANSSCAHQWHAPAKRAAVEPVIWFDRNEP